MRKIVLTLGRSSSKALNATCIDGPPTPRWQSGADPARIRVSLTTAFVNDGLLDPDTNRTLHLAEIHAAPEWKRASTPLNPAWI